MFLHTQANENCIGHLQQRITPTHQHSNDKNICVFHRGMKNATGKKKLTIVTHFLQITVVSFSRSRAPDVFFFLYFIRKKSMNITWATRWKHEKNTCIGEIANYIRRGHPAHTFFQNKSKISICNSYFWNQCEPFGKNTNERN